MLMKQVRNFQSYTFIASSIIISFSALEDVKNLKALGHDISKRFVTKCKRIVRGPSFR